MAPVKKDSNKAQPKPAKLVTDGELRMLLGILKHNKAELKIDWDALAADLNIKASSAKVNVSALRRKGILPSASTHVDSSTTSAGAAKQVGGRKRKSPADGNDDSASSAIIATGTSTIIDNAQTPTTKPKKAKVQKTTGRGKSQVKNHAVKATSSLTIDSGSSDDGDAPATTARPRVANFGGPKSSASAAPAADFDYESLAQAVLSADNMLQSDIMRSVEASSGTSVANAGAYTTNNLANMDRTFITTANDPEAVAGLLPALPININDEDVDEDVIYSDDDDMQTHPGNKFDQDTFTQIARASGHDSLLTAL
ncbi:hypothetical protein Micbo1qcDRAFT_199745 [Microdochium bolleyi]|uniref:Uncharacterized protein n=1 Tax=Microdochium bolleyi TaxID=196109 RepID=A0A136JIM6_9PEZI|nr:hypothetical protein Micbo1qcDRAFT_199745 [Microdochium bolleyi]